MAIVKRGTRLPLKFGATVTTGYVTESIGEKRSGKHTEIEDEQGNFIADISNYGLRTDVTLEVMPEDSIEAQPEPSEEFTYGTKKMIVESCDSKEVKAGVMKWTIAGYKLDGVPTAASGEEG